MLPGEQRGSNPRPEGSTPSVLADSLPWTSWSGRHPVTVENTGSSPVGSASPVEQRSARRSDTAEAVGSNPTGRIGGSRGAAWSARHPDNGTVRQCGRAAELKPWRVSVRIRPVLMLGPSSFVLCPVSRELLFQVREPDQQTKDKGPRTKDQLGLLVQQEDAALARRRSGCNSPAVHCQEVGERRSAGLGSRTTRVRIPPS